MVLLKNTRKMNYTSLYEKIIQDTKSRFGELGVVENLMKKPILSQKQKNNINKLFL
jgi:hypothetical protein